MALPIAIQQTLADVQSHYKKLHEQVLTLQSENLDLKKELQEIGARSHSKVMESLINENHRLKAQVRVIEGPNPPGFAPEEDELISIKTVSLEAPEVRSRIRKVSTQAVHDAVHIRKHMMNGDQESEDGFLASDKIKMLKMDPFADTPMDSSPPLFSSVFGLCFPIDIRATEKERLMKRFTNGLFFKSITMLAIAANTLYLGWAANTNVSNSWRRLRNEPVQQPGVEFDIAFTAWFGVELFIKMIADRVQFFVGEERAWNWFDMALVGESFVGLFSQGSKLSFLRIFRVFRLVRVVKVVRSVKALARLRTMIFAILSSFVDLLWAFLVIVLIVFVFAIVFDNAVADYFDSIAVDFNATDRDGLAKIQEVEDMNTLFGNLPETMISLWSAVSGGNDWMNYGDYLRTAGGWFYFGLFNFYIAFCVVGMFNVVTGVFVDSAVCVRTGDEVVQGYLDDLRQTTEVVLVDAQAAMAGSTVALVALSVSSDQTAQLTKRFVDFYAQNASFQCENQTMTYDDWLDVIQAVGDLRAYSQEAASIYLTASSAGGPTEAALVTTAKNMVEEQMRSLAYGSETLRPPTSQRILDEVLARVEPPVSAFAESLEESNGNAVAAASLTMIQALNQLQNLYIGEATTAFPSLPAARVDAASQQILFAQKGARESIQFVYGITGSNAAVFDTISQWQALQDNLKNGGNGLPAISPQRPDLSQQWQEVQIYWDRLKEWLTNAGPNDISSLQDSLAEYIQQQEIILDMYKLEDLEEAESFPWMFVAYGVMGLFLLCCACGAVYVHWSTRRKASGHNQGQVAGNQA